MFSSIYFNIRPEARTNINPALVQSNYWKTLLTHMNKSTKNKIKFGLVHKNKM